MSRLSLMLVLPLALPLAALAATAPQQVPLQVPPPPDEPGMVVVRDPETGQLRAPTPLEARALRPRTSAAAAAAAPPRMVVGPGGRRSVRLGERHMVYSVVTRDANGKLSDRCIHGEHAAGQALTTPATPATPPEEPRHENR
ncbi:post-PEP-CTERM-1 domain-containing protein [Massilia sp. H6]|uniref:post-PEP-CTERM-1 domain-containing protein n=1 Tax=Massilia sp. H6 TaxID=2970464 RepID=UPI002169C911|nr:hypothetical protein [Massilia sp. H6]UVW30191.1 hypothetical protein NRS07_08750 [Massilia sp. H6]